MSDHKGGALGAGMFGKESGAIDVYLNLTPLMDVMSNILFFLMSAFGASAVAVLSLTVPVDATGDVSQTDAVAEDKVTVTLRADPVGFTVSCQDPMKLADELKMCGAQIAKKGKDYDTETLTAHLVKVKQKFSGANTIMVVPDDDIKYEILVKILDATRDVKGPDGKKLPLFPDVVMSSLVQ